MLNLLDDDGPWSRSEEKSTIVDPLKRLLCRIFSFKFNYSLTEGATLLVAGHYRTLHLTKLRVVRNDGNEQG